jgi:hypothetical protein
MSALSSVIFYVLVLGVITLGTVRIGEIVHDKVLTVPSKQWHAELDRIVIGSVIWYDEACDDNLETHLLWLKKCKSTRSNYTEIVLGKAKSLAYPRDAFWTPELMLFCTVAWGWLFLAIVPSICLCRAQSRWREERETKSNRKKKS